MPTHTVHFFLIHTDKESGFQFIQCISSARLSCYKGEVQEATFGNNNISHYLLFHL